MAIGYTGVLSGSGACSPAQSTIRLADDDNGTAESETLTGSGSSDAIGSDGGDDQMIGGSGNDSHYVDSVLDAVSENARAGSDHIYAGLSCINAANVGV
jgi:Ca2+-binding RTX toxin-like protein